MTSPEFSKGMQTLAGLPFPPQTLTSHWEGLKDLPADVFFEAVALAVKRCQRHPSPYELRMLADERTRPMPPLVPEAEPLDAPVTLGTLPTGAPVIATHEHRYHCDDCRDNGWFAFWCGDGDPGQRMRRPCGRHNCPYPHEWVDRCVCVGNNPVIQRRREAQAQYAAGRVDQNQRRSA